MAGRIEAAGHVFEIDVRVDLGGGDARVAECVLDGAEIGDAQQSGGERVAEDVRGDGPAEAGECECPDFALDGAGRDGIGGVALGECVVCGCGVVEGGDGVPGDLELGGELACDGDGPVAFGLRDGCVEDEGGLGYTIVDKVAPCEACGFSDAQAGLEHEPVGEWQGVGPAGYQRAEFVEVGIGEGSEHGLEGVAMGASRAVRVEASAVAVGMLKDD